MRYLNFLEQFKGFNVISNKDINKVFGSVDYSQLSKWKKEQKITSPKKGFYIIAKSEVDVLLLANELNYSYVSLEYALSYYQIIPDVAQVITSVSKNRNEKINNKYGNFHYRKINKNLFTGFVLIPSVIFEGRFIRIADPEKAIFDLIYFRADLKNKDDFQSLRLNLENIKMNNFKKYINLVRAPQIKKRLNNFFKFLNDSI